MRLWWIYVQNVVLRVRFEFTTSAYLILLYKYGALTDCATGADIYTHEALAIIQGAGWWWLLDSLSMERFWFSALR